MNKKNKIRSVYKKNPSKDNLVVDHIKDQLEEKMQASAMDINLFAKDGVVHLSGMVDVLSEKKAAEDIVKTINGVKKIENKITIAMDSNITDKHMEKEVANRLLSSAHSEDLEGVGVKIEDGVANLVGNANTLQQAHQAMDLAAQVRGVKDVVNNINVGSSEEYDDAVLNSRVTQALSTVDIGYEDIGHWVQKGKVTLDGYVDSQAQMEAAKEITMGVEGVKKVVNKLKIRKD